MELKYGLFLQGELMAEYDYTPDGYEEALEDAAFAYQETGIPHEVKQVSYNEVKR